MNRLVPAQLLLMVSLLAFSCSKRDEPLIIAPPGLESLVWQKMTAPDGVSFTSIIVTSGQTVLASSGDYPFPANNDGYIYRSTDAGNSWSAIDLHVDGARGLIEHNSMLFAATTAGVYRSVDDGQTWSVSGLDSLFVKSLDAYISGPANLLVAGTTTGLYRSQDDGQIWIRLTDLNNVTAVAIVSSEIIFAGTIDGLNAQVVGSLDGGASWTTSIGAFGVSNISVFGSDVYAGGGWADEWTGGLMRSTDSGLAWERLYPPTSSVRSVLISPVNDTYICGYNTGVQVRKNDQEQWIALHEGLSTLWIVGLAIDDNNGLYAASDLGGIFRSNIPSE